MNAIESLKTEISKWIKLEEDEKHVELFAAYETIGKRFSSILKGLKKALASNYKVCCLIMSYLFLA